MGRKTADWSVPAHALHAFLKKFPRPGFEPAIFDVAGDDLSTKPHIRQLSNVDSNI